MKRSHGIDEKGYPMTFLGNQPIKIEQKNRKNREAVDINSELIVT